LDVDHTKVQRIVRKRAERTQIKKKRSVSLSIATAIVNDDAKVLITNERSSSTAERISRNGRHKLKRLLRHLG
jgi:hypothetical protein